MMRLGTQVKFINLTDCILHLFLILMHFVYISITMPLIDTLRLFYVLTILLGFQVAILS